MHTIPRHDNLLLSLPTATVIDKTDTKLLEMKLYNFEKNLALVAEKEQFLLRHLIEEIRLKLGR